LRDLQNSQIRPGFFARLSIDFAFSISYTEGAAAEKAKRNVISMTKEFEKLKQDLLELGVNAGDVLLVHSSMKALGTKLSPEEVLDTLEDVLSEEGTLLLPALTYENVTEEQPVFDSTATEPCIGLLPRTFFHREGVKPYPLCVRQGEAVSHLDSRASNG